MTDRTAALCLLAVSAVLHAAPLSLDDAFHALPAYNEGGSREGIVVIERAVRRATPARRREIERRLGEALRNPQATADARRFACLTLMRVISDESVALLGEVSGDEDIGEMALRGLVSLDSPAVDTVLLGLLAESTGQQRVSLVRALAQRSSGAVTDALAGLLTHRDGELAAAVREALCVHLSRDATGRARTLAAGLSHLAPDVQLALLPVLAGTGNADIAPPVAALLKSADKRIRLAALRALAELRGAAACPCALEMARSATDDDERQFAMQEALRLAAMAAAISPEESTRAYLELAKLARTPEEKKLVDESMQVPQVVGASVCSGREVEVVGRALAEGKLVYTDRTYIYKEIPKKLVGATYIKMAMEDKQRGDTDYFTVTVSKPVTVYVGFDHRAEKPAAWLSDWSKTGDALRSTDHGCRLELYTTAFPAGKITLSGNASPGVGAHYVVVITE